MKKRRNYKKTVAIILYKIKKSNNLVKQQKVSIKMVLLGVSIGCWLTQKRYLITALSIWKEPKKGKRD